MKKIVALVLALALALSLCTVAFAAAAKTTTNGTETEVSVSFDEVTLYRLGNTKGSSKEAIATESNITAVAKKTQVGQLRESVAVYNADNYTLTFKTALEGVNNVFSVVDEAEANYSLKLDKTTEIYLVNYDISTEMVFTSKVAKASKAACGVYYSTEAKALAAATTPSTADGFVKVYLDEDDVAYQTASDGDSWAYYNGTFVRYGAKAYAQKHVFDLSTTKGYATFKLNSKNESVPTTATCKNCGKTFDVVESGDLNKNWVENDNFVKVDTYFVVLDSAVGGTTTTTTTVDSSKTFDAGVAMYVGLSLMSVAGSAVVIGKKKEF